MGNTDKKNPDSAENIIKHIEAPDHPIPEIYRNPTLLFAIIILLIFFSEIIAMYALSMMPPLPIFPKAIIDSFLLTLILLPLLFLLVLKPFQAYIAELQAMKKILNQEVITDELTGLLNRRGLFTIAQNQCELATRNDFNMSFIFMDIDSMKMINDEHGHKTGDAALIDTANILMRSFRSSDIIGRIGGDEFIAITAGSTDTDSSLVTKRLKDNLKIHNEKAGKPYKLSLSIGLILYDHENPCSIDELFSTADKLMYEQKRKKNMDSDKGNDL